MLPKVPARSYNVDSLERWFNYIQIEWELFFDKKTLDKGRKLYLSGNIKGIELQKDSATVYYSPSRKETIYSIIDWENKSFNVRASCKDVDTGNIIAVGGLYEIEELVADEISPIGKFIDCVKADPNQRKKNKVKENYRKNKNPTSSPNNESSLELQLTLNGGENGLILNAFWLNTNKEIIPVFKSQDLNISQKEREQVVKLTVLIREAGFKYRKFHDDFILEDFERIAGFFSHAKKRWDSLFSYIDLDDGAREMANGIKEVEISAQAEGVGRSYMNMNYQFKLGSEWLDHSELNELYTSNKKTKYFRGKGIVSIKEPEAKAIESWGVRTILKKPKQWPRYMLYSLWIDHGIKVNLAGELKRWLNRLSKNKAHPNSYKELPFFLREYQLEGVYRMNHIYSNGGHCLLADEMGLGKTLQVLSLIKFYAQFDKSSLIVCPASVVPVWKNELDKWYPEIKVEILKSNKLPKKEKGLIWISSYSLLRRNIEKIKASDFEYLVLDEAQCIKNPNAKVTIACCEIHADYRLAITGTPLENKLLDLWSIFNFLMPGLMGNLEQFTEALEMESLKNSKGLILKIRNQISPFFIRRLKDLVAKELPEKTELDLICPIKGNQKEIYNEFLKQGLESLNNKVRKIDKPNFNLFTLLTRLRQSSCDPGVIPGVNFEISESGKVLVLISRLQEAFYGTKKRKIVIFSQFVKFLNRLKPLLKKEFPDINIYELKGSTRDRNEPVSKFQNDNNSAIILVSLKAGGTGVTLNSADYLFLMDPWWNPAVENQAIDRVHRMGQKLPVFIFRMVTKGTIEERIQILKSEKSELFEKAFKEIDTVRDIKEYFSELSNLSLIDNEPANNKKYSLK